LHALRCTVTQVYQGLLLVVSHHRAFMLLLLLLLQRFLTSSLVNVARKSLTATCHV
jgi:hypothetical protein